jgi:uncharacterized phage protein (TIGR02218 family)
MSHAVINYQSPYTASSLKEHMAGPDMTTCACWKLTPVDAAGDPLPELAIGATSATFDLHLPGHVITFKSNGGVQPTDVDTEAGQQSAGLDLESIFTLDITEEDVAAGIWNGAKFEVYTVNYNAVKMGQHVDFSGRLRKISSEGPRFKAEANPLTAVYGAVQLGYPFTRRCRARRVADKYQENLCKLDPAHTAFDGHPITVTGTVTTGGSNAGFTDASRTEDDDWFELVKITSGSLAGREIEVRSFSGGEFLFQIPASEVIAAGVTYEALRRCKRTAQDCWEKFGNIINHRGFPKIDHIEGVTRIIRANV